MNADVETSLKSLEQVTEAAKQKNIRVRGLDCLTNYDNLPPFRYVSCVIGCPYEGPIDPNRVAKVSERLLAAGCYES